MTSLPTSTMNLFKGQTLKQVSKGFVVLLTPKLFSRFCARAKIGPSI